MDNIKIPVGRSGFADIRRNGYYYIDKSGLIEELLKTEAVQVTLITRPRRFGKTLGMNMLYEFFDIRKDSRDLFAGLSVADNKELCREWMNQYPVLFLSFKSIDGLDFTSAVKQLKAVFSDVCVEHYYLLESENVNEIQKECFKLLARKKADTDDVKNGLNLLVKMLEAHYGKPVVLFIDEYDVPLAKASEKGYYNEMLDVIKGIMQAVKDNNSLKFAVITGCLRIAKESIFTGTNNFVSDTISNTRLNEYFGFTQEETDKLLEDTGLSLHAKETKEWYDGYLFGEFNIYCPWDVMNYVNNLLLEQSPEPGNFWENTSDNAIIRSFLERTDFDVNDKFEVLLSGGYIKETIIESLTYDILMSSEENLWSLLYMTGYLTRINKDEITGDILLPGQSALKIPNAEVMDIFRRSVKSWFTEKSVKSDRRELFTALWNEDAKKLSEIISDLLFDTISYHDYKESFYHAFITGLVSNAGFQVESNYENGLGRSDIVVKDRKNRRAVVIEAKRADSEMHLEQECINALKQIDDMQYAVKIEHLGYKKVGRLGISFWQKKCMVKKNDIEKPVPV